jgi:hypothetical protein
MLRLIQPTYLDAFFGLEGRFNRGLISLLQDLEYHLLAITALM